MTAWYSTAPFVALSRLQRSPEELQGLNVDLHTELRSVSLRLSRDFLPVGTSAAADALTGDDAAFWGEAVGLLTAARLLPVLGVALSARDIVLDKQGPIETRYAPVTPASLDSNLQELWADEAWDRVQQIVAIATARMAYLAGIAIYDAQGPRRVAIAAGYPGRSYNPLYTVLSDMAKESGYPPPFYVGGFGQIGF